MEKVISTKVHGMMDYPTGLLTACLPLISRMKGAEAVVPMIVGGSEIVQSLFTDYELGVSRKIPMKTHLLTDIVGGVLLAASPFVLGFSKKSWLPHVLIGLMMVGTALLTKDLPSDEAVQTKRLPQSTPSTATV